MTALPDVLPCGRETDEVLALLGSGRPDPHRERCEHCAELAAATAPLWREIDRTRGEEVRAPEGFVGGVLDRLTREPPPRGADVAVPRPWRAGPATTIDDGPRGFTELHERVVVRLVGAVLRRTPGVGGVRTIDVDLGRVEVRVGIELEVREGWPWPATAAVARAAVVAALERTTRLEVRAVDLVIVGVVHRRDLH